MRRFLSFIPCLSLVVLISGCGAAYKSEGLEMETPRITDEVKVEAYLFDARLHRGKKPTSIRLEFYHTDSVLAIAGTGYLGKGALRGRLTDDSLEVYFPSTDEYLRETVTTVLGSMECASQLPPMSLLVLFSNLPDSVLPHDGLTILSYLNNEKSPEYVITADDCLWEIRLTYVSQTEGWRIKEFLFDDGKGNSLKGKRRTYKAEAKIRAGKFLVPVKPESMRIIL